jgi:hypothetical protein
LNDDVETFNAGIFGNSKEMAEDDQMSC